MLLLSVVVGLLAGFSAGMLGISPGGILVPLSVMVLGAEQHTAQVLSLVAQVLPTSLLGVRQYRMRHEGVPIRLLVWIAVGFLVGTVPGAVAAIHTSGATLRWTYVGYLLVLLVIIVAAKNGVTRTGSSESPDRSMPTMFNYRYGLVGFVAGLSSGYLGIGGGLAITVGLTAFLGLSQLRSQSASLAVALLPLTLPAVVAYWGTPWFPAWSSTGGIVIGLFCGTDLGARFASTMSEKWLKSALAALLLVFALYLSFANLHERAGSTGRQETSVD